MNGGAYWNNQAPGYRSGCSRFSTRITLHPLLVASRITGGEASTFNIKNVHKKQVNAKGKKKDDPQ
jgi:hypothetical protein